MGCGVDAKVLPTRDLKSLPKSLWGRCSSRLFGWNICAKSEVSGVDFLSADVDVNVSNEETRHSCYRDIYTSNLRQKLIGCKKYFRNFIQKLFVKKVYNYHRPVCGAVQIL